MYKIHKSSDKEPRAFIHQNKIHGTKTIHITDDGERILCTLNLESQIAGWEKWLDESQMNAFIVDLLMLQEYKNAYHREQDAKINLHPEQAKFEVWAKDKKIRWVHKDGEATETIRFKYWDCDNIFRDTNHEQWWAYGHGLPEDPNGGYWEEVV